MDLVLHPRENVQPDVQTDSEQTCEHQYQETDGINIYKKHKYLCKLVKIVTFCTFKVNLQISSREATFWMWSCAYAILAAWGQIIFWVCWKGVFPSVRIAWILVLMALPSPTQWPRVKVFPWAISRSDQKEYHALHVMQFQYDARFIERKSIHSVVLDVSLWGMLVSLFTKDTSLLTLCVNPWVQ